MHTEPEVTRIVRSWLHAPEHESADRVLGNVLGALDTTPQRRSRWPAWRLSDMNTFAKLGIAAAAVVVVAIVGFNLMPASGGVGGGPVATASPSPTPTPTAAPTAVPTQAPTEAPAAAFPPEGPLAAGTHTAVLEGIPLSFTVPASDWMTYPGFFIGKGGGENPDDLAIAFWPSAPENVYADPCAHTPLSPVPDHTVADLAAAAAAIPGTDLVSGPSDVEIDGRPAQHVVFTIRADLGCDPKNAYLWYDDSSGGATGGWHWASALGATHQVWIIDVDGTIVWIDSESFEGAGPEVDQTHPAGHRLDPVRVADPGPAVAAPWSPPDLAAARVRQTTQVKDRWRHQRGVATGESGRGGVAP